MKHFLITKLQVGCCSVVLWGATLSGVLAYVGDDVVITPQSCHFTTVTGAFGPDGSIRYNLMGTCNGIPITGETAYGTNRQMAEKFYYQGAQIRTTATCPDDPWISGAPCEDQQVAAKGADPGSLIYEKVPLSLRVVEAPRLFQNAHANAAHPKPPGPPVNAKAVLRSGFTTIQKATVSWLGPDQQGAYGPYLNFIVEARPQQAEGAAWIKLGGIARHAAQDYRLIVQFPPTPQGMKGWEVRACSTTVFTRTCTGPIIPTLPPREKNHIDRIAPGSHLSVAPDKKGPMTQQQLRDKAFSESISSKPSAATNSALNPQPLPPKAVSPSTSRIPSEAGNAALNPQPLPPKALRIQPMAPKSFGFGSIMRRGIPESEEPTAEGSPADTPPAEKASDTASPIEAPLADEKAAP